MSVRIIVTSTPIASTLKHVWTGHWRRFSKKEFIQHGDLRRTDDEIHEEF